MRKIKYPLIVSDFDGTLVRADGSIDEGTQSAIAEYIAAGGKFALSTGRMPYGILSRARELGLEGVICCCQGSIIVDIQTQALILEGAIPKESAIIACEKMEEMGLHIHAYGPNTYYSNKADFALKAYEKIVKVKAKVIADMPMSQFIRQTQEKIYKLLAMMPAKESEQVMDILSQENLTGCSLTKSADFFVEVIPEGYSKGSAVAFLAEHYGVAIEKTVAVGDQHNDLPMIERAGVGIAVQNADKLLKYKANYICERTNEQGAIAEVIEKFGFYEEEKA